MGKLRAATYARVSTTRQSTEDRYSLREQAEGTRDFCERQGYEHAAHLFDVMSGDLFQERPQLAKLLEMIRRREVDVVVVMTMDRLSRNPTHIHVLEFEFDQAGVKLDLVTEKFDDTPEGQVFRSLSAYLAQKNRLAIRDYSIRGKKQRVREGRPIPSNAPIYGYDFADKIKSHFVIDEESAAVVRRIFREMIEGNTTRKIAFQLNEEGVPTPYHTESW